MTRLAEIRADRARNRITDVERHGTTVAVIRRSGERHERTWPTERQAIEAYDWWRDLLDDLERTRQ